MNETQKKQLETQGFLLIKQLLPKDTLEQILRVLEELWEEEGEHAGVENYVESGVRRLANLANKGDVFRQIYGHREVMESIKAIIGPNVRAAMVNARDVPPYSDVRMPYHTDTDDGRTRDSLGYSAATAIWMMDAFTLENGATALVPGSHQTGKRLRDVMPDPYAAHPREIIASGSPGDVLVFNGHCWHAGRPNRTSGHRRALLVHYLRSDVPRSDDRRQHIDKGKIQSLTKREAELLGIHD